MGFFGGGDGPDIEKDTLRANSITRILDIVCEGPATFVGGLRALRLNGTPLYAADGRIQFNGVKVALRAGTMDQTAIELVTQVETEKPVGQPLKSGVPVTRYITNPNVGAVRVRIGLPGGLVRLDNSGDQRATSTEFDIQMGSDGGAPKFYRHERIEGKTLSPFAQDFMVILSGQPPWTVAIVRTTSDATSPGSNQQVNNASSWDGMTEIVGPRFSYPGTCLVAWEFDSSKFGTSIPQRSYLMRAPAVQVPINYNPETRDYTGLWSGEFKLAYSNNPAWVLYNILTHKRYGVGRIIPTGLINKWAYYKIAQLCDELVPDGKGGWEPRFTCNAAIYEEKPVGAIVSELASVFRGMSYYAGGQITVVADERKDPVGIVAPANVIGDEGIEYEETAIDSRHSVVEVQWSNPVQSYDINTEVVEDAEMIRRYGRRVRSVRAFGTTSRGQAIRVGRSILAAEKWEGGIAHWRGAFEQAWFRPGDVVKIPDSLIAGDRFGGRLRALSLTELALDQSITLTPGLEYTISIIMPDGEVETRNVMALHDDRIEVDPALSVIPVDGAMWAITGPDVAPQQYSIQSISEDDDIGLSFTGRRYERHKFDWIDFGWEFTPDPVSRWIGELQPPASVLAKTILYRTMQGVVARFDVSWAPPVDPRVEQFEVEVIPPDQLEWRNTATTSSVSMAITDGAIGHWQFRVRSVAELTEPSAWAYGSHDFGGLAEPPPDVEAMWASELDSAIFLQWVPVTVLDLQRYEIRSLPLDQSPIWERGNVVASTIPANAVHLALPPESPGWYMIKAVDQLGNYSINATAAAVTEDLAEADLVDTITEEYPWDGVRIGTAVSGAELTLARNTDGSFVPSGSTEFVQGFVRAGVEPLRFSVVFDAVGRDPLNALGSWGPLGTVVPLGGLVSDKWSISIDVAISQNGSDFSTWVPMGSGFLKGKAFRFRMRLYTFDNRITPAVFSVIVNAYSRRV